MSRLTGKDAFGMFEAYQAVYVPQVEQVDESQEEIDEAVKGEPSERRQALAAERRSGHRPLPAKEGEKYASHKLSQMSYAKRRRMGEEVDIFDVVLEFLQAEGYAETLEEAEWIMANKIDEEAIDIILGEASRRDEFTRAATARNSGRKGGITFEPGPNWDPSANRGRGAHLNPKQKEKQRRKALAKGAANEEFELWVNALVEEGYDLSDYTWDEMYEFYLDEGEKPFPHDKVTAQQKRHTVAGRYGNMMKMGLAKRRAKEAEKTGGSQRDAGKGWYHGR